VIAGHPRVGARAGRRGRHAATGQGVAGRDRAGGEDLRAVADLVVGVLRDVAASRRRRRGRPAGLCGTGRLGGDLLLGDLPISVQGVVGDVAVGVRDVIDQPVQVVVRDGGAVVGVGDLRELVVEVVLELGEVVVRVG